MIDMSKITEEVKMEIDRQVKIRKAEEDRKRQEENRLHDKELEEQRSPILAGEIIECVSWGRSERVRGIIHECEYMYESRWSPRFCTHPRVKHEVNDHWKGTSCEGIGKDLDNDYHDKHPEWCPKCCK